MKHVNKLTLGLAALVFAGTGAAQTAQTTPATTTTANFASSLADNPGVLGHTFLDLNYSWVDFTEDQIEADGFIAGIRGNAPVAPGLDAGFGYSYYRENDRRNPFTGSPFDVRAHQLSAGATFYAQNAAIKPFLSGGVGYQWSRGDLQSFRIDDDEWLWGASVGAEIPFGRFAVTPRVSYSDMFRGGSAGQWAYGAEAHHWFTDSVGGYLDATFHNPRDDFGLESWTYTAGLRLRF